MDISIVAQGEGMRGAYVLGVIDCLFSDFGLKRVNVATASSASTGTLAYYVAGQSYPGFYIWTDYVTSSRFLSKRNLLRGRPFLDIDYLIDYVFKEAIPLDPERVRKSHTRFILPLSDAETGATRYYNNWEHLNENPYVIFELLRAAKAMPIAYGKNVFFDGMLGFDGGVTDPIPIDVPEVKDTRKIIIITNSSGDYNEVERHLIHAMRPWLRPGVYNALKERPAIYKEKMRRIRKLEEEGDIIIHPQTILSSTDNSPTNIMRCIKQGRSDVRTHPQIHKLMDELRKSPHRDFYLG